MSGVAIAVQKLKRSVRRRRARSRPPNHKSPPKLCIVEPPPSPVVPGLPDGLLINSRVVMHLFGLSKWDLQKYIDCGVLHPVITPDPHRFGGPNGHRGQARKFHRAEIVNLYQSMQPKSIP